MVSAWLVIISIIMAFLVLACVIVLVILMGHPDDAGEAKIPRIVVIAGMWIAFASVLILPYDVANSQGGFGGIRVDIMWETCYMLLAIFLSAIIPFAFFFYESDMDDEKKDHCLDTQTCGAIKYTAAFFVVFALILIIMYVVLNTAHIPVTRVAQATTLVTEVSNSIINVDHACKDSVGCVTNTFTWNIPVTFPVFVMAFLAFWGWWFFALFAGVGLIALPLDLINAYRTRPTPMSTTQYFEEKRKLGERTAMLIKVGEKLQEEEKKPGKSRKEKSENEKLLRKFESHYYFIKKDYAILYTAHKLKGGNPLVPIAKLVMGILGLGMSACWIIHISIFVLPAKPYNPFLNTMFIALGNVAGGAFPLFGVVAFACFAYYLIWCVVKGNFKLGVRFLFWKIYPMEFGNTLMNAFLANTWIILLCSVPCIQFCATCFPVYARFTSINMLFGTQVQYLPFFSWFWNNNFFVIILVIFSFFTLVQLIIWPKDHAADIDAKLERINAADKTELNTDSANQKRKWLKF